jgi:hypothetical protein
MKAIAYQLTTKSIFSALMILMMAVALFIIFTPAVRQASSLQEAVGRRAVNPEDIWPVFRIGLLGGLLVLQIPLWLCAVFFAIGARVGEGRNLGDRAKGWFWAASLLLAAGGFVYFILTPQSNPRFWDFSSLRFLPVVLSGFPAGVLCSTTGRDYRWTTILPYAAAFFWLLVYIANCKPGMV